LIHEKDTGERSDWYEAVYVSPIDLLDTIRTTPDHLARRGTGIFAFDPSVFYPRWKPMIALTGILVVLIIALQVLMYATKPTGVVFQNTYDCEADTGSWDACKPVITPSFKVKGPSATEIQVHAAGLDNDWVELQIVLVNDDNGKLYEVNESMELYHGVEDGESWSEGDNEANAVLSDIPSGNYHMNIYPFVGKRPDGASAPISFSVKVLENRFLPSNLILMLLLVLTYPTIQYIRKHRFENSIWFKGDYTTNKE
jgi:hypothetical protein